MRVRCASLRHGYGATRATPGDTGPMPQQVPGKLAEPQCPRRAPRNPTRVLTCAGRCRACLLSQARSAVVFANAIAREGRGCADAVSQVARQYTAGTPANAALLGQLPSQPGAAIASAISDTRVTASGSAAAANHGVFLHGLELRQLALAVAEAAPVPPPGIGLMRGGGGWAARVPAGRAVSPGPWPAFDPPLTPLPPSGPPPSAASGTTSRCPAPKRDRSPVPAAVPSPHGPPPGDARSAAPPDLGTRLTTPPCPASLPPPHPVPRPETRSPPPALQRFWHRSLRAPGSRALRPLVRANGL